MLSTATENDVSGEEPTGDDVCTCSPLRRPLLAVVADSQPDVASLRTSTLLYDSRRGIHYEKPLLRGWLHLVWFEASLVAGTLLVVAAPGMTHRIGVAIYAGCLSGLFGVSALYHRGNWGPAASRMLQRADHVMIFLLITGTATPVFLLAVPGTYGLVCLIVLWSLTAAAVAAHLGWMSAPERLVGGVFVGLGAANALAVPACGPTAGSLPRSSSSSAACSTSRAP